MGNDSIGVEGHDGHGWITQLWHPWDVRQHIWLGEGILFQTSWTQQRMCIVVRQQQMGKNVQLSMEAPTEWNSIWSRNFADSTDVAWRFNDLVCNLYLCVAHIPLLTIDHHHHNPGFSLCGDWSPKTDSFQMKCYYSKISNFKSTQMDSISESTLHLVGDQNESFSLTLYRFYCRTCNLGSSVDFSPYFRCFWPMGIFGACTVPSSSRHYLLQCKYKITN